MRFSTKRMAEVTSTNDEAKRLAHEGAPEGTVVIADRQTAGRGRQGRVWVSTEGNLFLSLILRPSFAPADAPPLAPAMGLAVALAIENVAPLATELKWPNDVRVNGRKVAGVLTESLVSGNSLAAIIVGIGLNVGAELPPDLAEIATTLSREAVRNVRKGEIEKALLVSIDEVYARFVAGGFPAVAGEWSERDALNGHPVKIADLAGVGRGITPSGAYRIEVAGTIREITTGEVL